MRPNADCTIYLAGPDNTYTRVEARGVSWEETRGLNISKTGSTDVDSVFVALDLGTPLRPAGPGHDYLVKGICSFDPATSPIRDLVTSQQVYTITSIAKWDGGSRRMQHWEVYAK